MQTRGGRPVKSTAAKRPDAARAPANTGITSDRARTRMVEAVQAFGVRDPDVLSAMDRGPRHLFVEQALASRAYEDVALPIGHGQTISRPSIVGRMLELVLAHVPFGQRGAAKALEIGTGCGYQAAVMAQVVGEVVSVERLRALHEAARANLRSLRQANLRLVFGDGRLGVPQVAPFDAIVVAAAGESIPDDLLLQMKVGGRLVAPITSAASGSQSLHLVERAGDDDWHLTVLDAVRFVPLRAGTR
ncbi:MAG TPA: protein-L-isoaspartate(D-aspartate) O-methyltransferase [Burkholderiaceae bacterium]|nr:protein-L-isoaspartate(D-aspartate) O-methyltransferase [Burkholderiaceae bacterium]